MNDRTFETVGSIKGDLQIDLDECHTDPVHQSAHIQPHGTLLEVNPETLEIRSAAQNVIEYLNGEASSLIGQSLDICFDSDTLSELHSYFDKEFPDRTHIAAEGLTGQLSLYLFPIGEESAGIEIEADRGDSGTAQKLITNVTDQLNSIQNITERTALFNQALKYIASFTGYDRLMIYQFDQEGHGSVVAEQKTEELESYLGRRFPASDIPEPARRLYRKNTLRLIPKADHEPVPIIGPDGKRGREELDLTYSDLRSVPAVHREYMKNMGVAASLSVSLMVKEELWGLIACHAMNPRKINWSQKSACTLISGAVSQQLNTIASRERDRQYDVIRSFREEIDDSLLTHEDLFEELNNASDSLTSFMDANGFYLEIEEQTFWAQTEHAVRDRAEELLPEIQDRLKQQKMLSVRSIKNEWTDDWSHSTVLSGFLACRLTSSARSFCVWFRPEFERTIEWGGDPRNPVEIDEDGKLSPRNSFDSWTQLVSEQSRRWTDLDQFTAREICRILREIEIELQKNLLQKTNQKIEKKNNMLQQTRERLEKINQEKDQLLEQVQEMARTDDLTGLSTRDEFMNLLESEITRSKRYDHDLALVFMDLDHFKAINDEYGHQMGDRVLKTIGELLRDLSRDNDLLGRYGGEEFIAVLPNTSREEAASFSERFLDTLRERTFESEGGYFDMTCSIGIAELRSQDDAERLIERADTALYRAKNSGRDTYCISDDP